MAIQQRVLLKNPRHFVAPGGLNFEKHFRLHVQEKTRYYDELAELTDDQRNMRTVTPGYVEGMTRRWMALYHGEIAAAQYMGVAAHNVPLTDYWVRISHYDAPCTVPVRDEPRATRPHVRELGRVPHKST